MDNLVLPLMTPPSLAKPKSQSIFQKSACSFSKPPPPSSEELKEAIDKSKEYLKIVFFSSNTKTFFKKLLRIKTSVVSIF